MKAEDLCGKVLGTCTLQKVIGRGGMGAVYLAQQSRPNRQVAVKVLLPIAPQQPKQHKAFLERFRRETDAAASLDHPNIIPVHEYGERDGLAYLVMPYISGGTLRDELDAEGKLPLTRVVMYLEQIAVALDFAHTRGVIHRDIKPANILMTPEKRLLLTDFGLVKIITGDHAQNQLSEAGMPMGTPDYMSPEQVVGQEIDSRADIYALGVLLYHMLTGTVPFKGDLPMKVAMHHLRTPPPSPRTFRPDLPLEAEQVIFRALAKKPADRYAYARDLAMAFREALEGAGVQIGDNPLPTAKDENSGNRRRGLFDPVWRNPSHEETGAIEPATRKKEHASLADKIASSVSRSTGKILASEQTKKHKEKAQQASPVMQTSITLPSFSGLLTDAHIPATSLPEAQPLANILDESLLTLPPILDMPDTPGVDTGGHTPLPPTHADQQTQEEAESAQPVADVKNQHTPLPPVQVMNKQEGAFMSVNQPPFPFQPEQNGPTASSELNPNNQFSRMRMGGLGKTNLRGLQAANTANTAPSASFNEDATQAFQPAPAPTDFGSPNDATARFNPPGSLFNPGGNRFGAPGQFGAGPSSTLQNPNNPDPAANTQLFNYQERTQQFDGFNTGTLAQPGANSAAPRQPGSPTGMLPATATGALVPPVGEYSGNTGMLTLNQAVKVVKIPIAGRPGEFKTGILPVVSPTQTGALPPPAQDNSLSGRTKKNRKAIFLIAMILLVLIGSGSYLLLHAGASTSQTTNANSGGNTNGAANIGATATAGAQATATYITNHTIVQDSLSTDIHSWPVTPSNANTKNGWVYFFQNGAYHILQNSSYVTYTTMPSQTLPASYTYNLTMQSEKTDLTQGNLSFYCMIMNYKDYGNGKVSFYMFRVNNVDSAGNANVSYEFDKYDNRKGVDGAYQELFPDKNNTAGTGKGTGKEFRGPHQANQYTVIDNNGSFTFLVNGTKIGTAKDTTFTGGGFGMGVSQQGTQTAFSNLLLLNN